MTLAGSIKNQTTYSLTLQSASRNLSWGNNQSTTLRYLYEDTHCNTVTDKLKATLRL